jgi:hypothetical protein
MLIIAPATISIYVQLPPYSERDAIELAHGSSFSPSRLRLSVLEIC